jgi:nucleotide-binding universal stress UspA family protein
MSGHILLATDGSPQADRALLQAARLSQVLGLDLCIFHVLMYGRPGEDWMRMAEIEHLIEMADHGSPDGLATSRA